MRKSKVVSQPDSCMSQETVSDIPLFVNPDVLCTTICSGCVMSYFSITQGVFLILVCTFMCVASVWLLIRAYACASVQGNRIWPLLARPSGDADTHCATSYGSVME